MDVDKVKVDVIGGHAGTTIMPLLSQVPFRFRSAGTLAMSRVEASLSLSAPRRHRRPRP